MMNITEFLTHKRFGRIPHGLFLPGDLTCVLCRSEPDAYEKLMAIEHDNLMIGCVSQGTQGVVDAFKKGRYVITDFPTAQVESRLVDAHDCDAKYYRLNFERIHGDCIPYMASDGG